MATALTLQIPDNVYEPLLKRANQIGQTPEKIVTEWIENAIKCLTNDPLLQLAGVFESDVTDVSERHDEYIGQSLRNDNE